MKKFYFLLLIGFCMFSNAQTPKDSLLLALKEHPQKDTLRCFLLDKLIEEENDHHVWIVFNNELKKIAFDNLKIKKQNNTFQKYFSKALNNQGAFLIYNEKFEESLTFYKQSYQISKKINFVDGCALALQNIGGAYDYLGKLDSTLVYMQKAYFYAKQSKNTSNLAYIMTDLGFVNNNLGNTSIAIKYNLEALPLFQKLKDDDGLERTYFSLARIFDNQKDFKTSDFYYEKCLEIDRKSNNQERITLVLNSLATVNIELKKINKSIQFTEEAFNLAEKFKNIDLIAASYKNFGDIYLIKKDYIKANANYLKAFDIYKKLKSDVFTSKLAIKIATVYLKLKRLNDAKYYAILGFDSSDKTNFPADKKNAAKILSEICFEQKNFKKAYEYQVIASNIGEKIFFDESKDVALKATFKYETEKKESQITKLSQKNKINELESKRKTSFLLILSVLFLAISSTAVVLFSRYKVKKQNEILAINLAETQKMLAAEKKVTESELKALRSQMNPHFIFNALNTIQQQFMYGDKMVANENMNNFSYLTRQILEASGKKKISLDNEIEILTKYLDLEKMRFVKDFEYNVIVSDKLDLNFHAVPPMLIQPFAENAVKHGLLHRDGLKKLDIHFDLDISEDFIVCTITDNGIGREASAVIKSKNNVTHNSFSTEAINQRLELLNENLQLKNLVVYSDILNEHNEVCGTKVVVKIALV